jgi:dolichyl-phosphate-mannose--protein O-mannosyl transferase
MWAGMLALAACAIEWLRRRSREAFLILFFYLAFLIGWVVIPRTLSFYYYYYPAGMTLSLALAYALRDRGQGAAAARYRRGRWLVLAAAAGVFVYFLPVLSGSSIGSDEFRRWMWFQRWI